MQRIAILGMGLIGSSLARALCSRSKQTHIAVFDIAHDASAYAVKEGFAHSQHAHPGQAASGAEMVVLAVPPCALGTLASDIAPFLAEGAVVTDTASVKCHSVAVIAPHMGKGNAYVPGHPIAGSEQRGVESGRADLFAGKRVILTPQESELMSPAVARVRGLWESVGARVEYMPAELHDRIYAYVSHLPQIVAFASGTPLTGVPLTGDETMQRFARLMKSNPMLWADICCANANYIADALEDFSSFVSQVAGELSEKPAAGGADAQLAATLYARVTATCLIATASLLQEMTGVHPARYAGSGFADMTAPAVSDPEAALAAISDHHWVIAKMLKELLARLGDIGSRLKSGDRETLARVFEAAQQ